MWVWYNIFKLKNGTNKNNTIFISPTIKDLKQDLKYVEKFEHDEWVDLMKSMGYKDVEGWSA